VAWAQVRLPFPSTLHLFIHIPVLTGGASYILDFCAADVCVNSCDAKAECDPAGWGPLYVLSETCPLNVCCSQFGFCGTTPDFCGDLVITNPSCPNGISANQKRIGYYEGWSDTRPCDAMFPEQIPVGAYTHLNYGFASIDPTSFSIAPADPGDVALYSRLTGLKALNPGLEVSLLLRYLLKANLGFMAHSGKRFGFRSVAGQCESSPSLLFFVFAQALLDLTH
jgi:hypothetical protein